MFDFSFAELLLCFVVALVVLGPERLPGIARSLGRWTGQAKSYMRNLSAELERESQLADIKKQVVDAQRILREESASFQQSVKGEVDKLDHGARASVMAEPTPPAPAAAVAPPAAEADPKPPTAGD